MGPTGGPDTSVWNYHSKLRKIPEERRSYLHRGGSLKSRILGDTSLDLFPYVYVYVWNYGIIIIIIIIISPLKHTGYYTYYLL
jgi:hypothetical protein